MFKLIVDYKCARLSEWETLTSGSVGPEIQFEFSPEWEGLIKTVCFDNGAEELPSIPLRGNTVEIPQEAMRKPGNYLRAGVYGETKDGTLVIPTVYACLGNVCRGAEKTGRPPVPPAPDWTACIEADVAAAIARAENVERQANAGEFKGDKGETGPQGPQGKTGPAGKNGVQINDSAINSSETLSSVRSSELFGVSLDVEAEIVSEVFIENYPLGVISKIKPKPEGSGEPAWTGAKLTGCGSNLFNKDNLYALLMGTDGTVVKGKKACVIIHCGKNADIYVKGNFSLLDAKLIRVGKINSFPEIGAVGLRTYTSKNTSINSEGYEYVMLSLIPANGISIDEVANSFTVSLEDASYEPYNGTDYTVQFGQDVYGGEFNWTTGILTKTIGSDRMPLPTPITVQLAPREIHASKGISTFFSDTGNTHVTGAGDVKAYIDKKFAELATAYNGGVNA